MEFLAFIIWLLLALAISLILIVICGYKYTRQVEISKIIFRFFIAIVAYIPFTFFSLILLGALGNAIAHKKVTTSGEMLFCFVMVFIYAVVGWLLCAFVNGSFIKPWLIFSKNYNKSQTIFDKFDD